MTERIDDLTAIVVAGGQSSRMGRDKAFLDWQGRPLIQAVVESLASHVSEVIVVAKDEEKFKFLKVPVYQDRQTAFSPLVGIATGLFYSRTEYNFFVACDMPFVKTSVVRRLYEAREDFDTVIPESERGLEPLFALYHQRCWKKFEEEINRGTLKIIDVLRELRKKIVPVEDRSFEDLNPFSNLNTPEEYLSAILDQERENGFSHD